MVVVVAFVAVYCGYKFGNVSVTRTARERMHFPERNGVKASIKPLTAPKENSQLTFFLQVGRQFNATLNIFS